MPHPYAHAYVCGRKDTPHSQAHYPPTPSQVPGETSPPWRRAGRSARVHNLSHLPSGGGVWPISRGGEISIFLNFCFLFSLIFVFSLNRGAVTNSPLLLSRGPPMPRTCKERKRAKVEWSSRSQHSAGGGERPSARSAGTEQRGTLPSSGGGRRTSSRERKRRADARAAFPRARDLGRSDSGAGGGKTHSSTPTDARTLTAARERAWNSAPRARERP